jgi:hypothetical protein
MRVLSFSPWRAVLIGAAMVSTSAAQEVRPEKSKSPPLAGFRQRSGPLKEHLIRELGGNAETEAAVARGLLWLGKRQKENGSWEFDGSSKDSIGATGLALQSFLGAGFTHRSDDIGKCGERIGKALAYLQEKQAKEGSFEGAETMTSHALATIALCECYAMTLDPKLERPAQAAVDFILKSQAKDGSWGEKPGDEGDPLLVVWQVRALRAGQISELAVPAKTLVLVGDFLSSVSSEKESRYGGRDKEARPSQTAAGLLCRQFVSNWGPINPSLAAGVEYLKGSPISAKTWDAEYAFHATEVVRNFEGKVWFEEWNPAMRTTLLGSQSRKGDDTGSWPKDTGRVGEKWGTLGTTTLSILTLEVYYRSAPRYRRGFSSPE